MPLKTDDRSSHHYYCCDDKQFIKTFPIDLSDMTMAPALLTLVLFFRKTVTLLPPLMSLNYSLRDSPTSYGCHN